MQIRLPCVLMRGGTSRGPFFLAGHLPADPARRDALLLAAMGSPHPLQIDGIGGGNSLTSKTAIVGPSEEPGVDVEYLFAQVSVDRGTVDTRPNCGNMLAAVGPFAIEAGLVRARAPETLVRIRNRNTGALVEAVVQTPDGRERLLAGAVVDASGTWTKPNPLGADGYPALGERENAHRITYGIPDLRDPEVAARYAGKHVAVAGKGASAQGVLVGLADYYR